jgi:hypothetical protein
VPSDSTKNYFSELAVSTAVWRLVLWVIFAFLLLMFLDDLGMPVDAVYRVTRNSFFISEVVHSTNAHAVS